MQISFSYFEGGGDTGPCCGDGECNGDETSDSCPEDCGGGTTGGGDMYGCTDMTACNYDEEATMDDGSCEYETDCAGDCGGSAEEDECGECNGPGADFMCSDGSYVCDESQCSEPGDDPFSFNQSTQFAFYFVFSAYDCEGDYLEAGEDWIGVFNGDVCVGGAVWPGGPVDVPAYGDDGESYSAGYLSSGDMPTYKIYDASEDVYYSATPNENFSFSHLGFNNVYRMDAGVAQDVELQEGANLVSFYILPEDNSVENVMAPISDNVSAILSSGQAAQNLEEMGFGWIGSLMSLEYEEGYWMIMSGDDELNLEGCDSPLQSLVYDLNVGANLISYPDPNSMDLSIAIPDNVEGLFSAILGEGGAAMNTENGWVGSLTHFSGGSGYWMIVDEDLSFSYNFSGLGRVEDYSEILPIGSEFNVTQSSKQAFYFVENIELIDGEIENGDWLLSYNGDVLTGIRQWKGEMVDIPVMGYAKHLINDDLFVENGTENYLREGMVPQFKLLKNHSGELVELNGENVPSWEEGAYYTISGLVEVESIPEEFGLEGAYPNPFNPVTTLSFKLPMESQVSLQVYNLQGRLVETLIDGNIDAGYHSVVWNADEHGSGMYFVKMISGDKVSTLKLLLVK